MAYQTGTPASLPALMNDLKAFAIASGGFTDTGSGYTASSYTYFSLTKGSIKFGFSYKDAAGGGDIMMNTGTAWAGSGLLTAQTGACAFNARAYVGLTPIRYWMFTDGYSVHCVVNFRSGAYAHLSFGVLEKYGTYTGGEYVSANYWSTASWTSTQNSRTMDGLNINNNNTYQNHVRCTYLGNTIAMYNTNAVTGTNCARFIFPFGGTFVSNMTNGEILLYQPNSYNGRAVLIPCELFIGYDNSSYQTPAGWIPLGKVGNAAWVNMTNINAEDTVNTDWMVFPLCMKNPANPSLANGEVDTSVFGLAYKK